MYFIFLRLFCPNAEYVMHSGQGMLLTLNFNICTVALIQAFCTRLQSNKVFSTMVICILIPILICIIIRLLVLLLGYF